MPIQSAPPALDNTYKKRGGSSSMSSSYNYPSRAPASTHDRSQSEYFGTSAPMTSEPELITTAPAPRPILTPLTTPSPGYFSSASSTSSSTSGKMTDQEKKKCELQMRVWSARMQIPGNIPFRVFREPEECVEAEGVLRGNTLLEDLERWKT